MLQERPARNRLDAEERLISAAADLLGEVGPQALSLRTVADRAGVNHGLIHHYFGGKSGLLRAAMTRLVQEHEVFAKERSHGNPVPAALALTNDQRYLRAVVRSVLDDEMELALTELSAGVSVPRGALQHATAARHLDEPDIETKAQVAAGMAMEMGWAALEPFLFAIVDVTTEEEREAIRARVRKMRHQMAKEFIA